MCGVSCNFSFILIFFIWTSFFFFICQAEGLFNFLSLFKEPAFSFIDLLYFFKVSISFISTVVFMISSLLLTLGLPPSNPLPPTTPLGIRLGLKLLLFLELDLHLYKLPLRTVFAASHRFWNVTLWFSFVSRYFWFLWFLYQLISCLVAFCFSSIWLCFF